MSDPQHINAAIPAISTKPGATEASERPLAKGPRNHVWRFVPYHPALLTVLPAVIRFCSDVLRSPMQPEVTPYWLTILGPSGVGKTLALRQAFNYLSNRDGLWNGGDCAHVVPGIDLCDWRAPKDYGAFDLIYVEDIGAGAYQDKGAGAVVTSRVAELLQYRPMKWTLLDANLSLGQVETRLDPRIASRLKRDGSILIQLPDDVPDYNDRTK